MMELRDTQDYATGKLEMLVNKGRQVKIESYDDRLKAPKGAGFKGFAVYDVNEQVAGVAPTLTKATLNLINVLQKRRII